MTWVVKRYSSHPGYPVFAWIAVSSTDKLEYTSITLGVATEILKVKRRVATWANKTTRKMLQSEWLDQEYSKFSGTLSPPSLSLKLASRAFILLRHSSSILRLSTFSRPGLLPRKKKIKQVGVRERERRGSWKGREGHRMGGECYCGETAYTWVWFLLHPLLHHHPTQTEVSFLPLTQTT